ncbi:MAG: hypothetical protein ACPG4X_21215 [Pikeienuella sp.]
MKVGISISIVERRRALGGIIDLTLSGPSGTDPSLVDNEDGTFTVFDGVTEIGTITQAQIDAGGWITVRDPVNAIVSDAVVETTAPYVIYVGAVAIEDTIEVIESADTVVATALPFDITALSSLTQLRVLYTFSTADSTLEIYEEVRAETVATTNYIAAGVGQPYLSGTITGDTTGVSKVLFIACFEAANFGSGSIFGNIVTGGGGGELLMNDAGTSPARINHRFEYLSSTDVATVTRLRSAFSTKVPVDTKAIFISTWEAGGTARCYHATVADGLVNGETASIAAGAKFLTNQTFRMYSDENGSVGGDWTGAKIAVFPITGTMPDIPTLYANGDLVDSNNDPRSADDINTALGNLPLFDATLSAADATLGRHTGTFGNTVSGTTITPVDAALTASGTFAEPS